MNTIIDVFRPSASNRLQKSSKYNKFALFFHTMDHNNLITYYHTKLGHETHER